jgi:ornithine cyclodeaminase
MNAQSAEKIVDMNARMLSPAQTAAALPYNRLAREIEALLNDPTVQVPPRIVQALMGGGSLFVMPAADSRVVMTKLISFNPSNSARGLPTIQGDIVVLDVRTGQRLCLLDGPTVTARRTAAVSLLAAQKLVPRRNESNPGPLLIVGAGVQGRAHLEAFHQGLGVQEVGIASRQAASVQALVRHAQSLGMHAYGVEDPNAAMADFPWVVSATPAQAVVLTAPPRADAFVAAVGAFTPRMVEWSAPVCQQLASSGTLVLDTRDADHEAGDLLQAGVAVNTLPTLADVLLETELWTQYARNPGRGSGPVFFKSCGWAGWDLAAARCVVGG